MLESTESQKRLSVGVLIATYNRADLIDEAIDSLLAQTRIPDEIIVVDDGSTDNTENIIKNYQNSSIKYIAQPNRGLPSARNVGLRSATTDLIAFLDSDDTLPPESIARRAEYLEKNPSSNIVYGAAYYTDMQGKILGLFRPIPLPSGWIFHELACRTVFPMHAVMLRRHCAETIGYFDENLYLQLDFDYWARAAALYPFDAINEILAFYRLHNEMSVVAHRPELLQMGIGVQQRIMKMPMFETLTSQQKAHVYTYHGTQYLRLNKSHEARKWYLKAVRVSPKTVRNYVLLAISFLGRPGIEGIGPLYRRLRNLYSGGNGVSQQ